MKWKTLITAILIGTSSMATVAAAQPSNGPDVYYRHHRRHPRPHFNRVPDRTDRWNSDDDYNRRPVPLAAPLVNTTGQQEYFLTGQRYRAIQLDVMRGRLFVGQVLIQYADGDKDIQQVNQWLNERTGQLQFRIDPRRDLSRIIIYTPDNRTHGAYQLTGY